MKRADIKTGMQLSVNQRSRPESWPSVGMTVTVLREVTGEAPVILPFFPSFAVPRTVRQSKGFLCKLDSPIGARNLPTTLEQVLPDRFIVGAKLDTYWAESLSPDELTFVFLPLEQVRNVFDADVVRAQVAENDRKQKERSAMYYRRRQREKLYSNIEAAEREVLKCIRGNGQGFDALIEDMKAADLALAAFDKEGRGQS